MTTRSWMLQLVSLLFLCHVSPSHAQVDYGKDSPWDQRAESGPDAIVPGWFYNLGITGLRAQLVADEPKALLIKYVFPKSPADGQVRIGDLIVGADGRMFQENHRNGYGEKVFGADGPISELAQVLEECQSADRKGKFTLTLRRGKEIVELSLDVGTKYGTFAPTFPHKCQKSDLILAELLQYLVDHQRKDGSFGDPVHDTFAPLALLASGEAKYLSAVERNVKYHCGVTKAKDLSLINWSYMSAAIVLSEYHLATGDKTVLPDLQKVYDLMAKSQYLHMSQINPQAQKSHPDSFPKGPKDSHGGWGHNPGFEGYGPIAMLTGQGALAYSLMHRCGIKIDRKNHDAAYDFLSRGTGENGYVWYGDQKGGGPNNWADMGRTGAAGIANFLSPYDGNAYRERAMSHARVIGAHPQSFPDTHGSPMMGMAYATLAASVDADSFRKLMDNNRWWFTMAHCTDGSFYYQPNRDNSYYGSDSRTLASSVTAFILTIPKRGLVMTGKEGNAVTKSAHKPGTQAKPLKVFILAGQSNMQGHASVTTFDSMADDPKTALLLKEMRDNDGKPKVCEKVWISSIGCLGDAYSDLTEAKGKLTAGFGAPENKIGPEFTFGLTMEKQLNQPVLIIKTSWGGRSLHTDFRPPSAGQYKLPKAVQDVWEQHPHGAHGIPKLEDRKKWQEDKDAASGVMYRAMIEHVRNVTKDIKRVCPEYDENADYELAGFVWFQGFNDLVDGQTYPNGNYEEYSSLLAHFIRDVRKDLSAPKMPFVIGVLGVDGDKHVNFRRAMAAPADMPEFKGNVLAVDTAPFWDHDIAAAQPKQGEYNNIVGTAHTLKNDGTLDKERKWDHYWKPLGTPLPEERIWRFATVDATEKKDKLEKYDGRRFRDITLPAGMETWHTPDFDDSKWTSGKAPIGKGIWKHSGITLDKFPSRWEDGEFLLMRSTFEVEDLNCESYRIANLARQGFHVYLNGQKIHTYIWWQDKPQYGSIVLGADHIKHLKKGKNVLAVYANDQYDLESPEHYAAVDVWIEGITKADQQKLDLALEEVLSPKDRETLKGASNAGYHYFGSAKIFAQMGKAFAEALLPLQK